MSAVSTIPWRGPEATYRAFMNEMLAKQEAEAKDGMDFPNETLTELNASNAPVDYQVYDRLNSFNTKRVLVITIVKAWTPVCTGQHLSGYAAEAEAFKKNGIGKIVVLSPDNDDSLKAFIASQYKGDLIVGFPDFLGKILSKLGLLLDRTKPRGLGLAAQRSAMVIEKEQEKWVIKTIKVETNPSDKTCPSSGAPAMLKVVDSSK